MNLVISLVRCSVLAYYVGYCTVHYGTLRYFGKPLRSCVMSSLKRSFVRTKLRASSDICCFRKFLLAVAIVRTKSCYKPSRKTDWRRPEDVSLKRGLNSFGEYYNCMHETENWPGYNFFLLSHESRTHWKNLFNFRIGPSRLLALNFAMNCALHYTTLHAKWSFLVSQRFVRKMVYFNQQTPPRPNQYNLWMELQPLLAWYRISLSCLQEETRL